MNDEGSYICAVNQWSIMLMLVFGGKKPETQVIMAQPECVLKAEFPV